MSETLEELTEKALRLPPDDRAILAESLLLTISDEHDLSVDDAAMQELEKRLADLCEGRAQRISVDDSMRRIEAVLKAEA